MAILPLLDNSLEVLFHMCLVQDLLILVSLQISEVEWYQKDIENNINNFM